MSTPTPPRTPSIPITPVQQSISLDQARLSISRSASLSVTPKSEYLRSALQARGAQLNSPLPSSDDRVLSSSTLKVSELDALDMESDVFAEFALSEEQTTPVSPIRRRRPSDLGLPRSKTGRELATEVQRLKDNLITANMRVELLKKDNAQLEQDLTKANRYIGELELLQQENHELREEKSRLKLEMDDMSEEMEHLKESNDELCKHSEDMAALAEESASHWNDQELAIEEAAEYILKLEEEKSQFAAELLRLGQRVAAIENMSQANALAEESIVVDSPQSYNVNDSRPSTSHFDSDYYSQPGSPHVDVRHTMTSFTPSEQSKKILSKCVERRRSIKNLEQRISAASLMALSISRPPCPVPEVPQIPLAYKKQAERIVEEGLLEAVPASPSQCLSSQGFGSGSVLDTGRFSSVWSAVEDSPTHIPSSVYSQGSQGMRHSGRSFSRRMSNDLYLPSSRPMDSADSGMLAVPKGCPPSKIETSALISYDVSSMCSSPSGSTDHSELRSPCCERQSNSNTYLNNTQEPTEGVPCLAWPSSTPLCASVVSEVATELDSDEDRNRWWRNMDKLTISQMLVQSQSPIHPVMRSSSAKQSSQLRPVEKAKRWPRAQLSVQRPLSITDKSSSSWQDHSWLPTRLSKDRDRTSKTISVASEKPLVTSGAEDEESFIRKATAWIGSARR